MRSDKKSTPIPSPPQATADSRQSIADVARALTVLDHLLGAVAEAIEPKADELLPAELRAGIGVVRSELLAEAIATLNDLAKLTEAEVARRQAELANLANCLAGWV